MNMQSHRKKEKSQITFAFKLVQNNNNKVKVTLIPSPNTSYSVLKALIKTAGFILTSINTLIFAFYPNPSQRGEIKATV